MATQITNAALMMELMSLKSRVDKLEQTVEDKNSSILTVANDVASMSKRLGNIEDMFTGIKRFALWGLASPIITGAVIVILQHWLHI